MGVELLEYFCLLLVSGDSVVVVYDNGLGCGIVVTLFVVETA